MTQMQRGCGDWIRVCVSIVKKVVDFFSSSALSIYDLKLTFSEEFNPNKPYEETAENISRAVSHVV